MKNSNYKYISEDNGGIIGVGDGKKWGFINKEGIEICPMKYSGTLYFKDGFAPVEIDDKWGLIDETG